MKLAGRVMGEQHLAAALENRKGTLIESANARLVGSSYLPEFSVQARGESLSIPVVAVYKGYRKRQHRNPSIENHGEAGPLH
jgi:hypothetical protein